jgi:hypothetical protein
VAPEPAAEPTRSRVNTPVGGRAAARLERQAAEAARKKSGARGGPPTGPGTPAQRGTEPAEPTRRAPRRVVQGAVATVVVAVGVLGFWSFASPGTQETSAASTVSSSAPTTRAAAEPTAQPADDSAQPTAAATPSDAGPVRAPITVLNSTNINGLAGAVGDAFTGGGWDVTGTGKSPVADVATTTVYYTEGDAVQQQAAAQLVEQFPDVTGPVARYFDLPDEPTPGLVVVVTGNWQP